MAAFCPWGQPRESPGRLAAPVRSGGSERGSGPPAGAGPKRPAILEPSRQPPRPCVLPRSAGGAGPGRGIDSRRQRPPPMAAAPAPWAQRADRAAGVTAFFPARGEGYCTEIGRAVRGRGCVARRGEWGGRGDLRLRVSLGEGRPRTTPSGWRGGGAVGWEPETPAGRLPTPRRGRRAGSPDSLL